MNSLSAGEKRRLVSAMNRLIEEGKYVDIASIYGGEYEIPWRRLFMVQMEDELGEALPYWDWTEDGMIPDLWEGIKAPIKQGVSSHCGGGQYVVRDTSVQFDSEDLKSLSQDGFKREDFDSFQAFLVLGACRQRQGGPISFNFHPLHRLRSHF